MGAVLCGGLAVPKALGEVVFTRSTTTAENWALYTATFWPSSTGNYTLRFSIVAAPGNRDHTIFIDNVNVTGTTNVWSSNFESPAIGGPFLYPASTPNGVAPLAFSGWTFSNYSGLISGTGAGSSWNSSLGAQSGNQRAFIQAYNHSTGGTSGSSGIATLSEITSTSFALTAGQPYLVTFYQASRSGVSDPGALTYEVAVDLVPPAGPQGPQGPAGPQGAQGPAGAVGPTGPQGPAGATGPTGPAGLAGAQGPIGLTGPAGATGPQGAKGDTGAAGPQGAKGDTGAVGPEGPAGAQGPTGAVGPAGPVGATGPAGAQGAAGPKGDTGAVGAVGPQGPIGFTGPQGAAGPQGPQGPVGAQGPAGAVGPQGPAGQSGNFPVYKNVTDARAAGVAIGQIWVHESSGQVNQMVK